MWGSAEGHLATGVPSKLLEELKETFPNMLYGSAGFWNIPTITQAKANAPGPSM